MPAAKEVMSQMTRNRIVVLLTILLSCSYLLGQTNEHNLVPNGTIDGSVHPELVPDDMAWHLFMRATAESITPTKEEVRRQHSKLRAIGLSPSDEAILVKKLGEFHHNVKMYDEGLADSVRRNLPTTAASWATSRRQFYAAKRAEIESSLSTEGAKTLRAHIQRFKASIKLYPVPDMSGMSH